MTERAPDPERITVDLEDLRSGDANRVERASNAIRHGFGDFGLVYIRNHGLDRQQVEDLYLRFLELTARAEEEKRTWAKPELWYQRGWTPPNTEQAVVAGGQPDFKECYFIAPTELDEEARISYPELYAANVWPKSAEAFHERYVSVGTGIHAVGMELLRGCARALDLPASTFEEATRGGPHVTRLLRYLPLASDQVDQDVLWGEEHTDFNLLTLLPGGRFLDPQGKLCPRPDDGSGLYLRTRGTTEQPEGTFVRGTPPEGCIVAQVGQQLEILTGGTYLATPHVITAPKTPGYSRVSLAHFVHLHSDQVLRPLPSFRDEETVRAYGPPQLAGTYALKTLVDIGLAPPEALQQLGYRHYARLATQRER
jgi:isopenicillin N synthase-like dioxygenase